MKMVPLWRKAAFFLLCCAAALLPLLYDVGDLTWTFMRIFKVIAGLFIITSALYIFLAKKSREVIKNGRLLFFYSIILTLITAVKFVNLFLNQENPPFFAAIELPFFAVFSFFVYAFLYEEKQYITKVLAFYVLVATGTIVFFPNRFMVNDYNAYRFVGLYLNPNFACLFFLIACFFSLCLANTVSRFRWVFLSTFSINAAAIILTSSLSGLGTLLAGGVIVGFVLLFPQIFHFSKDIRKRISWKSSIYVLVVLLASLAILSPTEQDQKMAFKLTSDGQVIYLHDHENETLEGLTPSEATNPSQEETLGESTPSEATNPSQEETLGESTPSEATNPSQEETLGESTPSEATNPSQEETLGESTPSEATNPSQEETLGESIPSETASPSQEATGTQTEVPSDDQPDVQTGHGILDRLTKADAFGSLTYRLEIWGAYLKIMPRYFWLGTDFLESDRPIVHAVPKVTHNTYLYTFYRLGIFGCLGLIALTCALLVKFIRKKEKGSMELYLPALFCGVLLFSLLHDLLAIPAYWFVFGLQFVVLSNNKQKEPLPTQPERILQVFSSLDKGGAESRTMDLYRGFDRDKVQFDFVIQGVRPAGPESYFYYNEVRSLGGNVFGIRSWHEIGMAEYLRQWKAVLRSGHYRTVHSHNSVWAGFDLIPAWCYGVPNRIAHARDSGVVLNPDFRQRLHYAALRLLTDSIATEKIYCSREAADFTFGKHRYNKRNSHFLPNAINLSLFSEVSEENCGIKKKELGLDQNECVIGTVGNARPVKNHIFLVKAFHRFLNDMPQAKLLIVGRDQEDAEAKEYVANNGIGENVIFTGQREDVPELLSAMDLFVLPSFAEGAPGVVIEAQAANVPCILSDSITRDVDIGAGLLKYLSLNASLDTWVREMLDSCKSVRPSREKTLEKLKSVGYDVESSREKLLAIYGLS